MKTFILPIITFTLLAAIIDQLLPNDSYRKYANVISGFILILLFVHPVVHYFPFVKGISGSYEEWLLSVERSYGGEEGESMETLKKEQEKKQVANLVVLLSEGSQSDKQPRVSISYIQKKGEVVVRKVTVHTSRTVTNQEELKKAIAQYLQVRESLVEVKGGKP